MFFAGIAAAGSVDCPNVDVELMGPLAELPVAVAAPVAIAPAKPRAPGSPGSTRSACTFNSDCDAEEYCRKDAGDCDLAGECFVRPDACLQIFVPVCGCDGNTYPSACDAAFAGVNVAFDGPC